MAMQTAVMCEQGVEERAEHAALGCTGVESGWMMC